MRFSTFDHIACWDCFILWNILFALSLNQPTMKPQCHSRLLLQYRCKLHIEASPCVFVVSMFSPPFCGLSIISICYARLCLAWPARPRLFFAGMKKSGKRIWKTKLRTRLHFKYDYLKNDRALVSLLSSIYFQCFLLFFRIYFSFPGDKHPSSSFSITSKQRKGKIYQDNFSWSSVFTFHFTFHPVQVPVWPCGKLPQSAAPSQ